MKLRNIVSIFFISSSLTLFHRKSHWAHVPPQMVELIKVRWLEENHRAKDVLFIRMATGMKENM